MRRILSVTALMILLIFTAAVVAGTFNQKNKSAGEDNETFSGEQWEYLIVAGGTTNLSSSTSSTMRKETNGAFREYFPLESNMDKLGAKGWELVSIHGSPSDPVYYFKRKK